MTTSMSPAAAMDELWDAVVGTVTNLTPQQWDAEVPWCPGWSVGDLVGHLGGLQSSFNGDPQPEPAQEWTPPPGTGPLDQVVGSMVAVRSAWTPQQRIEELQRAAKAHTADLEAITDWSAQTAGPLGPTTHEGLYRVRAFDVWVHLQDLREALGLAVNVHDTTQGAAAAYDHVLRIVPWLYGKRAGAPEGSTLRIELGAPVHHDNVLRVVDGRAGWDPMADPGDCLVSATPGAFTLLTSGRGTPQRWRDAGVLSWSGPRSEDFVTRARMF